MGGGPGNGSACDCVGAVLEAIALEGAAHLLLPARSVHCTMRMRVSRQWRRVARDACPWANKRPPEP